MGILVSELTAFQLYGIMVAATATVAGALYILRRGALLFDEGHTKDGFWCLFGAMFIALYPALVGLSIVGTG